MNSNFIDVDVDELDSYHRLITSRNERLEKKVREMYITISRTISELQALREDLEDDIYGRDRTNSGS